MSDVHELTLREYYEWFAQSLDEEFEEEISIIQHIEPETIYLGNSIIEECEVIEILDESESDYERLAVKIHENPIKPVQHSKGHDATIDPLMLGKAKSLKAFRRNEESGRTRRVTRSCRKL